MVARRRRRDRRRADGRCARRARSRAGAHWAHWPRSGSSCSPGSRSERVPATGPCPPRCSSRSSSPARARLRPSPPPWPPCRRSRTRWSGFSLERLRMAIIANVLLALAVGVGFVISLGTSEAALTQIVVNRGALARLQHGAGTVDHPHLRAQRASARSCIDELQAAQGQLATLHRDAGCHRRAGAPGPRDPRHDRAEPHRPRAAGPARAGASSRPATPPLRATSSRCSRSGARDALAETRALVAATASAIWSTAGVAAALERLGERFERETGVMVTVTIDGRSIDWIATREVVLLRCAQEGLANVRKHARAGTASVALEVAESVASLTVTRRRRPASTPSAASSGLRAARHARAARPRRREPDRNSTARTRLARRCRSRSSVHRSTRRDVASDLAGQAGSTRMIRVLVADDHPIVRSGIVGLLGTAARYRGRRRGSHRPRGGRARPAARARPRADGPAHAGHRRRRGDRADPGERTRHPRAVLTTYESDDSILSAIEAGASGYLLKAAPQEEILAGIRSVARGEVALAPSIAAMLVRADAAPGRAHAQPARDRGARPRRRRGSAIRRSRAAVPRRGDREDAPAARVREARA